MEPYLRPYLAALLSLCGLPYFPFVGRPIFPTRRLTTSPSATQPRIQRTQEEAYTTLSEHTSNGSPQWKMGQPYRALYGPK